MMRNRLQRMGFCDWRDWAALIACIVMLVALAPALADGLMGVTR